MSKDPTYFISTIRALSNTETDPVVTDAEVLGYANSALAELYDLLVGTFEHYNVSTYDFTLTGGLGANSAALPSDFYKDVSLDKDPTTRPITVHRFTSWVERNNLRRRSYVVMGDDITVSPYQFSEGNYRLTYTPLVRELADPTTATTAYTTTAITRTIPGADAVDTSNPLAEWFFGSGPFTDVPTPAALYIQHASNSGNNGIHIVQSVSSAYLASTSKIDITSETFSDDVTASILAGPFDSVTIGGTTTWVFNQADFTGQVAGDTFTVAGSEGADGTFTISSVVDSHTVVSVESPGVFETFAPGVTVTFQPASTVPTLPQIFAPWYEYIQVHAAISILDKIERDSATLQNRLARLTQRIRSAASNRMEEGEQLARSNPNGFWDDDFFPF